MKLSLIAVSLLISLAFCVTLIPPNQKRGRQRADSGRAERTRIGLRQIEPEWRCFRSIDGQDEWVTRNGNPAADKIVQYENGTVLKLEEDIYPSGRTVLVRGSTVQEWIAIFYDHRTSTMELNYMGGDSSVEAEVDAVRGGDVPTIQAAADRILKKWGLSRL